MVRQTVSNCHPFYYLASYYEQKPMDLPQLVHKHTNKQGFLLLF